MSAAKEHYLNQYAQVRAKLPGAALPWLSDLRDDGLARFAAQGFPTPKHERWKYTRTQTLEKRNFTVAASGAKLEGTQLNGALMAGAATLVFVNGHYAADLSRLQNLPAGVVIMGLAQALTRHPELVGAYLGRGVQTAEHPFAALNTAFLQDGAFIYLAPDCVLAQPLQLLYVTTAEQAGQVAHVRNVIVADARSRAVVVESYLGLTDADYFTNAVTEVMLAEQAHVEVCKVQEEGAKAFHIAGLHVQQQGRSRFVSHNISLGGLLARNDIVAGFQARGAECHLQGLYMVSGRQHADTHTFVDHAQPECVSREYYKGILDNHARGVFNGRVIVREHAQKTDAHQLNKNLLLSEDAEVDTKPELEIYADDVKCAHGAAVGQIDEDAMFYLRSRGIGERAARSLLTYAFADEIVAGVGLPALRRHLEEILFARLPEGQRIKEMLI